METLVDLFGEMITDYERNTISGRQGKRAEDLFKDLLFWRLGKQPQLPSKQENMLWHIDWWVEGHAYDVKSRKAIRRGMLPQDNLHWIEYQNIRGDVGWLQGKSHTIAFELEFSWMLVNRERLLELVRERVDLDDVQTLEGIDNPDIWQVYHRKDQWDRITLAPLAEILTTEPVIWKK